MTIHTVETTTTPTYLQRAQFATSRRLLASLINEKRVIASISPLVENGIVITSKVDNGINSPTIFVYSNPQFIQLNQFHHTEENRNNQIKITEVVDPDDFTYPIFLIENNNDKNTDGISKKIEENDPVTLLTLLCPNIADVLRDEFISSVANQARAYEISESKTYINNNTGDINQDSLVWERSIIEGHPTHPMHRTRRGWSFEETLQYAAECFAEPNIYFVEIARSLMIVRSNFESLLAIDNWCPKASDPINNMVMPVHQGQAETIERLFIKNGLATWVMNSTTGERFSRPSRAQVAIRTVSPIGLDYHLKMSVNFQTTSNKRTISQHSVYQGPALGHLLSKTVPSQLHIVEELAAARYIGGHATEKTDVSPRAPQDDMERQLSCIIRADPEKSLPSEHLILSAALSERVPGSQTPWLLKLNPGSGLETESKRIDFFKNYSQKFLDAFIPPVRDYGIAIECHSQNVLVRFDDQKQLLGFAFRDFGGISFHRPTLQKTGLDGDYFSVKSTSLAATEEELYDKIFHCGIHSNLFAIMKTLNLHYSGIGCTIIKDILTTLLPSNHQAWALWFQPTVYYKGFISMRLANSPFDHANHGEIPRVRNFLLRHQHTTHIQHHSSSSSTSTSNKHTLVLKTHSSQDTPKTNGEHQPQPHHVQSDSNLKLVNQPHTHVPDENDENITDQTLNIIRDPMKSRLSL